MAKKRPQSTANDTSSSQSAPKLKAPKVAPPRRSLVTAPESSLRTSPESLATVSVPTEEDIRYRAYLRYLERGGDDGGEFDDWLYAERELKQN